MWRVLDNTNVLLQLQQINSSENTWEPATLSFTQSRFHVKINSTDVVISEGDLFNIIEVWYLTVDAVSMKQQGYQFSF